MVGYRWSAPAVGMGAVTVSGPEGRARDKDATGWDAIDWRACEQNVRRLRQRIFKAAREQDWPKVRNLQKLTAAQPRQHAGQRAAGDAAQRRAQDRRDRRGGRLDSRGQGGRGGAGAPVHHLLAAPRGPARAHTEGIKPCETPPARHSRDHGPLPPGTGPPRAGARVGGPVRAPVLRVPAGPGLPRRDRGDLQHVQGAPAPGACGRWTRTWRARSTRSGMITCYRLSGRSRPGT
jgi:hypothetical protein